MNNMSGIGSYSMMQKNIYSSSAQGSKTAKADTKKTDGTKKATNSSVQLSDKAKALLQELKKNYSNMDFFVTDSEDEAASGYPSGGTKDYSVFIDAEELERMANDDEVKNQNLSLLDEAVGKLDEIKEELKGTDQEDEVVSLGVSIGKDGQVSYFAELEKAGERQKEFIEKMREDKKEAAREAAEEAEAERTGRGQNRYNYEHSKRATVTADSVEDLLKQIQNFNWDNVREETTIPMPGGRFDLSV